MKKNKDEQNYVNDMIEWQEHQYTPWHYISKGKLPPESKAVGNQTLAAVSLFVCAFLFIVLLIAICYGSGSVYVAYDGNLVFDFSENWQAPVILLSACLLYTLAGLGHLRANKKSKKAAKERRKVNHKRRRKRQKYTA